MSESIAEEFSALTLAHRGTPQTPHPHSEDPETWDQSPYTCSHPPTASLTTGALALIAPGEVSVWVTGWIALLSRP